MDNQSAGWRGKLAGAALIIALFSVIWFVAAALGTKYGLWNWQFGFGKMTIGWGKFIAMGAVGLSAVAMIVSLIAAPRKRPFMLALGALLISGLMMGRLAAFGGQAARLPPIHDIQTDWDNPVRPSEILLKLRQADGAMNEIVDAPRVPAIPATADTEGARWRGMAGKLVSELQEQAEFDPETQKKAKNAPYPKLAPLQLDVDADIAYEIARDVLRAKGMEIVTDNATGGQLEATDTTGWYGFKDDVLIRITPGADIEGPIVDIRSVSRVGLSDLGANAKRVRMLLDEIERRAAFVAHE